MLFQVNLSLFCIFSCEDFRSDGQSTRSPFWTSSPIFVNKVLKNWLSRQVRHLPLLRLLKYLFWFFTCSCEILHEIVSISRLCMTKKHILWSTQKHWKNQSCVPGNILSYFVTAAPCDDQHWRKDEFDKLGDNNYRSVGVVVNANYGSSCDTSKKNRYYSKNKSEPLIDMIYRVDDGYEAIQSAFPKCQSKHRSW